MTFLYADNNATTRIAPAVFEAMQPFFTELWGNPSSVYSFGSQLVRHLEKARGQVAKLVGARRPSEIVFTSSGTESNCASVWSALKNDRAKRHIVTSEVEHPSIINLCRSLEKTGEAEVTYLPVTREGELNLDDLTSALRSDTALVSIMWANNETGVIFPIADIARICQEREVPLHVDAVQAAGKIPIDISAIPLTYLSLSAHKIHGPKGVGALFIRRGTAFSPLFLGHQEMNRRAGTENVAGIVGFGAAAGLVATEMPEHVERTKKLQEHLEQQISDNIPHAEINGQRAPRLPNTSNISFSGLEADTFLLLLDQQGVCASTGSACTAGSLEPSHVLKAMGLPAERLRSAVRFSLSRETREEEVDQLAQIVIQTHRKLQKR